MEEIDLVTPTSIEMALKGFQPHAQSDSSPKLIVL